MIAQLEKLPLEYSPGEAWIYSVATDVVGYLIQIVSGQSYADFVRARILAPLKMADSDFQVPIRKSGPLRRLLLCCGRQARACSTIRNTHSLARRPNWNPAAAAWRARPPIICASAACC